jgi:DNA-binding transcriptional LysR family regulator
MEDINFELYKIFYHAAKFESFSKAAAEVYITQSAVSQAIKNLESQLNVQLFIRKTRRLQLTSEGKVLFSHIGQAFNLIKFGENKIAEMAGLDAGQIRIGASDTVCKYTLLPYLQRFTAQYPKIKMKVINRTSRQITGLLENGSIDLGVVTLPLESAGDPSHIEIRDFCSVTDIFVAAPKYQALQTALMNLAQLKNYPLLLLEKTSATRWNFDQFMEESGIQVIPEIELESVDLLVEFARIGLGIAHVLKDSALEEIKTGELFEVKTEPSIPKRRLGVITLKKIPLPQAGVKFIELLRMEIGETDNT